jgi:hypothetical protein
MRRNGEDDELEDRAFGDDAPDVDAVDDDDALGHEAAASLDDVYTALCPYCNEENELTVDLGGGSHQSYVEDCGVCCRPWQVRVEVDDEGAVHLDLDPLEE